MGLESGSFINDLVSTNPVGATDKKKFGDDHLRLIKAVLKATFPGMAGRAWRFQSKAAGYNLTTTDNMSVIKATDAITLTADAVATLGNGFIFGVVASNGAVVFDPDGTELVNGEETTTLPNGVFALIWCDGGAFYAFALPLQTLSSVINVEVLFQEDVTFGPDSNIHSDWRAIEITGDITLGLEHDHRVLVFNATDNPDPVTITVPSPEIANGYAVGIRNISENDITVEVAVGATWEMVTSGESPVTTFTIPNLRSATLTSPGDVPLFNSPDDGLMWAYNVSVERDGAGVIQRVAFSFGVPGDPIVAGTGVHTHRPMPPHRWIGDIEASVAAATTTGTIVIDVNVNGTSIFDTEITIDAAELDTASPATPAVLIADPSYAAKSVLTFDIDDDGDGTAEYPVTVQGLVEWL